MYKIMLVDDEDEVREGITATVDFAACGFTLCAQATGAIDAIEKAALFQPTSSSPTCTCPTWTGWR